MRTFLATEYNEAIERTGHVGIHLADTIDEAVQQVLYTARLKNGAATIGPTGRVVHTGRGTALVVTEEGRRRMQLENVKRLAAREAVEHKVPLLIVEDHLSEDPDNPLRLRPGVRAQAALPQGHRAGARRDGRKVHRNPALKGGSMHVLETIQHEGFTIKIHPDEDAESPRTSCDNLGTMVCFHRRYNLGDKHDLRWQDFAGWAEIEAHLWKAMDAAVVLPLYLYDHSNITIRTTPFSCPWDSGQVGFIYVSKDAMRKEYGKNITKERIANATEVLKGEVECYDTFLTGGYVGYVVEDEHGEHLDSCWGFDDKAYCIEEAKGIVAYHVTKARQAVEEALLV